ncbi:MAG: ATP-binding protein [Pseudomonadota bacterium]|nr:ATP-binding protein [Pseudomonadota bacterium]
MPHQLRRIIAINLRNPRDGLPCGRIAELDPRGGVLAVGDNGVGKTTFLRLLPLFYGATPQQILRGTGLSSMLSHTLPDASSAVAFEYERETENDLRCVVMHCRPGEDAAQFHIIQGGYQEAFFCDENAQFVLREEFKARVEALGYSVSRKLFLHQYRSVILNERLLTKEGGELRRLAALHSLGPAPLYNLDQIAAAMANEKISFRDLQNIVIERVSDAQADASPAAGSRELKRNREDVSRWLDDRDHLAKIMAARPDAEKMLARAGRVKGLHLTLCTLQLAVKQALGQMGHELAELDGQQARLNQSFGQRQSQLDDAIAALATDKEAAHQAWDALRQEVAAADARLLHFRQIDVEALAAAQALETSLKNEKIALERDFAGLNAAAGGLALDAQQRKASLEKAAQSELSSIETRLFEASRDTHARSDALREAETEALQALERPARLKDISDEHKRILSRLGELKVMGASPSASAEILEKRRIADNNVDRLDEESRKAAKAVTAASEDADKARRVADSALARVAVVEANQARVAGQLADAQARLAPPPGSLLAFLRALPMPLWAGSARLIDPQLLGRRDLNPALAEGVEEGAGDALAGGRVGVGSFTLDMQALSLPSWVDMREVREQIKALQGTADGLALGLQGSRAEAQRLVREMNLASARLDSAIAAESLAETALGNAKSTLTRMDHAVEQDKAEAKRRALAETAEKQARAEELHAEEQRLTAGMHEARERLRADFRQQRQRLREEMAAAQARLASEKTAVLARVQRELAQLDEDVARARAGLGVDPLRLAALEQAIEALAQRLDAIAGQRHEVADWRRFSRDTLPALALQREGCEQLRERCDELANRRQGLERELAALALQARQQADAMETSRSARRAESLRLQELTVSLADFVAENPELQPQPQPHAWSVPDLEKDISQRRAALGAESEALQKDIRALRNLMTMRSGPVEHWLELKEQEMPEATTLREHQARCAQAQALGEWFNPAEHAPYVDQLHKEMNGFMAVASNFVRDLALFERRVDGFNRELQQALGETERFERFRDLSVTVRSDVGQIGPMKLLRHMQEVHHGKNSTGGLFLTQQGELPGEEDAALIRAFRDILPADGVLRVNLHDQVRLECSLIENGKRRIIRNEEDFRAVSSNGNTALITAMFLMGFVQMIRGADSPVRLTWVTDEIGRFDPNNLGAFLHTLDAHRIDVISASPSVDPALARFFPRLCIFEDTGAIATSETPVDLGAFHVAT